MTPFNRCRQARPNRGFPLSANHKPYTGSLVDEFYRRSFGPAARFRLLVAGLLFLASCSGRQAGESSAQAVIEQAVPVAAATVVEKTVPLQVRSIGNVQSYATISVKAQVGGELTRVHFTEGQYVKRGEILFEIDTRPFETAVKQAEANLAKDGAQAKLAAANLVKDTAQASYAEIESRRYKNLAEKGLISKEQYDQTRTNGAALQATVRADQAAVAGAQEAIRADEAAVASAKLQLSYCFIRSPIDGRTGSLMVNQGNLIKANDVPLVVIDQMDPVYVTFSVPEQQLPEIRKHMESGKLKVQASPPSDERDPAEGVVSFVDNAVDPTTGTIRLKGTFANRDHRLWPGQFVDVVVTLAMQPGAIVIPTRAIQSGQAGPYVFVIGPDSTVEARPVVIGRALDGESVIEKGLHPGERVVTDGQLRLVPGAKVEMQSGLETTG